MVFFASPAAPFAYAFWPILPKCFTRNIFFRSWPKTLQRLRHLAGFGEVGSREKLVLLTGDRSGLAWPGSFADSEPSPKAAAQIAAAQIAAPILAAAPVIKQSPGAFDCAVVRRDIGGRGDIGVTQIAHRLGVSPATLYRYMPAARTANTPGV
ncbi:MAG: hypothetical protein CR217_17115 [Beijerinckiaceae bacterium]|nr:MAG: hypothetical protein CR217_17115 [Beijerinckiaceae bacterium]